MWVTRMLTAEYLDGLTSDILELYAGLDESIVRDIAKRLAKYGAVTSTTEWQVMRAQDAGLLYSDVIDMVAAMTNASNAQVKALFEDAGLEAVRWDDSIYEAAGLTPMPLRQSPAALQTLLAGMKKTAGQLHNLTLTTALQAQQAYIRAATLAEMQVESGAFDAVTAIRNAVRQAALEGASVQYPSGHIDKIDVAVRRAVLTGVNQTAGEISLHNMDVIGCDLVEVTAHPGARPEHAAWQGQVYSRSGKHPKYPSFEATTGYGTGAGLCGWNCRHSFHPFFEGLSDSAYPREKLREYETRTVLLDGKELPYYEATQRQRAYERRIRATRRTLAGYDAAMKAGGGKLSAAMQADFSQASVTLKKQEARLKDFLRQTGLRGDSARVQVDGFGRSVSQRAIWANKKFTNSARNDTIVASDKLGVKLDVNYICKIDRNLYSVVTKDIATDVVIITERQIEHINNGHPGDYEKYSTFVPETLAFPDYILQGNKPNTALVLKTFHHNGTNMEIVLRLKVSDDPDEYKNSIITLWGVSDKRYARLLRQGEILYKKE